MKQITKVMMFVWRERDHRPEFLLVHRRKGDVVTPTGHVERTDKSLEEAARRETREEMGVDPIEVINLDYTVKVKLSKMGYLSTEHAFLIKVPENGAKYTENDELSSWNKLEELDKLMTYPKQKGAIKNIKKYFRSLKANKLTS